MKIYLDTCSLQRPLDDKSQLRVRIEAEAILGVIDYFEAGNIELVSSDVLLFEIERNPDEIRKKVALKIIAGSNIHIKLSDEIEKKSKTYSRKGLKPLDALHLASAIQEKVDYFCTCDDDFLRKAKSLELEHTVMVSPIELIRELENE